jgi:hypothetical protein
MNFLNRITELTDSMGLFLGPADLAGAVFPMDGDESEWTRFSARLIQPSTQLAGSPLSL